jgi:hypothetical protein
MLRETEIIAARVRDLENNIDTHGVDYYASDDEETWHYIGTTAKARTDGGEYFDFLWQTSSLPDGEYWLNVSVSDDTQLKSWDALDEPVFIHNSNMNPPLVKVLTPRRGNYINGSYNVRIYTYDLENNVDSSGVVLLYSNDGEDWSVLYNIPTPTKDDNTIYEFNWNTIDHPDGKYWLKAEATDYDGLKGEGYSDYFFIHNKLDNPPSVDYLYPHSGEFSGIITLNATVFDLESDLTDQGVRFYYSKDNITWTSISNDPTGTPLDEGILYYEISWDTSLVSDDIYWLRADAQDATSLIGSDFSNSFIIIHNQLSNPPRITFKQPRTGVPLSRIQAITVEVIDFDGDIEGVGFYYSDDNETWELIDTLFLASKGDTFSTMWNTEKIVNGNYYLKVRATDKVGNQEEVVEGPFAVTEGVEKTGSDDSNFLSSNGIWLILIIVIIIIMVLVILMLMKRSKRREKELIEEVSAEMQETRAMEGEGQPPMDGVSALMPDQSYVPAPGEEIIEMDREHYQDQMNVWRDEGYLVTRLENLFFTDMDMFKKAFPIFKMNIAKSKDISTRLETVDPTGREMEIDSIRLKLNDPDQVIVAEQEFNNITGSYGALPEPGMPGATPELQPIDNAVPQLMPAPVQTPTAGVPGQEPPVVTTLPGDPALTPATEPIAEVPPDIDLPPEIDLPPDTETTTPVPAPEPAPAVAEPAQPQVAPKKPDENKEEESSE